VPKSKSALEGTLNWLVGLATPLKSPELNPDIGLVVDIVGVPVRVTVRLNKLLSVKTVLLSTPSKFSLSSVTKLVW
jgi:hypothetical protein